MSKDIQLADEMRQLAAVLPSEAGTKVKDDLVAAFRARRRRRKSVWICMAAAVIAGALVIVGFNTLRKRAVVADTIYSAPGFVALPYSQSGVPLESAVVIRVQMRSSELSAIGIAVPAEPFTAKFKADFLIGQDGVPRAVRFVH